MRQLVRFFRASAGRSMSTGLVIKATSLDLKLYKPSAADLRAAVSEEPTVSAPYARPTNRLKTELS
jgi:hypothetical protein